MKPMRVDELRGNVTRPSPIKIYKCQWCGMPHCKCYTVLTEKPWLGERNIRDEE